MKQLLLFIAVISMLTTSGQTIYEIQGQQSASPLANSSVNTGGIVTGVAADGYFIQDGTGAWNGIYVYDQVQNPSVGDQVTLTATVTEYFTLTELGSVTNFEVVSTGNPLPEPVTVSTADANMEDYEGVLIRVEGAVCTNPDLGFNEFEVNDGSGTLVVDDLIYLFVASQDVEYNIQGIGYFSFDFAKILPTQASDVELASPLYYVNQPEEYNLANASMDINWTTNAPSNTILNYGLTTQYELGSIQLDELVTEHTVQLSGLTPATVYYIQAVSQDAENSTPVVERVVCTASESSGEIKVYFNHPVDTEVATVSDAIYDADIIATIVEYIGMAQSTLDITMYDVQGCDASIISAINTAHNNGVTVRYITDEELENIELDDLDPSIPILAGNPVGIMHNKFIVIDREAVDNTWVITGSTNHTWANMGWDFNNMICIQDQSLVRAYTLEFEEMWGTT
ncbi:MAG: hypothetical protein KDC12_14840, partial [Flavobacteriales bacterium]|nr:hypothetical protein [Flavobacteriales bacterium]